jgi:hypothetical protein
MTLEDVPILNLEALGDGVPVMPTDAVGFYKQNCMVCFHNQGHQSGVMLKVVHESNNAFFRIFWTEEVDEQLLRSYADLRRATDNAACAIALLLIRELTSLTGIAQACIGSTVDYYLTEKGADNNLIFNNAARLEVSGILREAEGNTVDCRIKRKIQRLRPQGDLKTYIVIVEFGQPWSKMVRS